MVLAYNELVELVENGHIENVPMENINGASIDLTIGDNFVFELVASKSTVGLEMPRPIHTREGFRDDVFTKCKTDSVTLTPGQFVLAETEQVFHLPDNIAAEFVLKSSSARSGLQHMLAGWCDPTWNNSVLTMELKNCLQYHDIILEAGQKIGQMKFFRTTSSVPQEHSYMVRGQYNDDRTVSQNKGSR